MNVTHLCQFCNLCELETVDHVITRCPVYDCERQSMLINLQLGLSWTPSGLAAYHAIAELDQNSLTLVLLGQHDPKWSLEVSALIHRVARQYFLICWEKRTKMLGKQPGLTKDGFLTVHERSPQSLQQQSPPPLLQQSSPVMPTATLAPAQATPLNVTA